MNNPTISPEARYLSLLLCAARAGMLKKAVLSKPQRGSELTRATAVVAGIRGTAHLQIETLHIDNKAKHRNLSLDLPDEEIVPVLLSLCAEFLRANLLTTVGDCELMRAASGKVTLLRADALQRALEEAPQSASPSRPLANDRKKAHILDGSEPFLRALDVSDRNGRVYDKKQAKFRQINRFLELLRDVENQLPATGTLYVCDLCCGKSYLSFAVYHYLTVHLGRQVVMEGVDLKADVIEHCNRVAASLGFDGLRFICGDVAAFTPAQAQIDLVVSLHACDIATDLVLGQAIRHGAKVILSTPCCHHELNHTLDCPELAMIARHSMLRQKLCDAATDAMRLLLLEAYGYKTEALELIDPEETPKNVMLRAVRKTSGEARIHNAAAAGQYEDAVRFFLRNSDDAQKTWLERLNTSI
ncbi:MAG: SAM-dependent methyltransferase [Clostridia bacterium]|nr:SAM-dependent methyltransferase [Clostridia bacterium]